MPWEPDFNVRRTRVRSHVVLADLRALSVGFSGTARLGRNLRRPLAITVTHSRTERIRANRRVRSSKSRRHSLRRLLSGPERLIGADDPRHNLQENGGLAYFWYLDDGDILFSGEHLVCSTSVETVMTDTGIAKTTPEAITTAGEQSLRPTS